MTSETIDKRPRYCRICEYHPVELLSDSPGKATGLTERGVSVTGTRSVSLDLARHPELRTYYLDKAARGYNIGIVGDKE